MAITFSATDCIYDGVMLSKTFNCFIGDVKSSSGAENSNNVSELKLTCDKGVGSNKQNIIVAEFEDCLEFSFSIFHTEDKDKYFKQSEIEQIERLFITKEKSYKKFQLMDEIHEGVFYYCKPTKIEKILVGNNIVGFAIALKTDRPYGVGKEKEVILDITDTTTVRTIRDSNAMVGETFPNVEIRCMSSGNLSVYNEMTDRTFVIKGCTDGEIITMNGYTHATHSNKRSPAILLNSDTGFNYNWFTIANTYQDRKNRLTFNGVRCQFILRYKPNRLIG